MDPGYLPDPTSVLEELVFRQLFFPDTVKRRDKPRGRSPTRKAFGFILFVFAQIGLMK